VHFSGHGSADGEIILADGRGEPHAVTPEALAETFRLLRGDLRCVVINACHSGPQADAIAHHVAGVVGMTAPIADRASIAFSTAFYRALAFGEDLQKAFDLARNELHHEHPGAAHSPQLIAGRADLSRVKLATETPPAEWVAARALSPDLHLAYLRRLFEQKWATVSMSLFDPSLGRRFDLLDIFTPLPVDFAMTARLDDQGRMVDWWCGRGDEKLERSAEAEWRQEAQALSPAERRRLKAGAEHMPRHRVWADLNADEQTLRPLIELAQAAARKRTPDRDRDAGTFRWQADASHAALIQPHFVLIGDPGSGKSTFLRHLALCWAGELLRRAGDTRVPAAAGLAALPGLTQPYTPLYIELRGLVAQVFAALPPNEDHAAALPGLAELRAYLHAALPIQAGDGLVEGLFELLRQGRAAILLDGLDEVGQAADPRRRAQMQAFVADLAEEFPAAPIIITARPYAYRQGEWGLAGFGRTELAPLPPARQAELAGHLLGRLLSKEAARQTAAFVAALERIPADLRSNPLLLTLLAALWVRRPRGEADLPSTRGELYRRALTFLLEDWVRAKVAGFSIEQNLKLSSDDLRLVLQLVACQAQESRSAADQPAIITEKDFFGALRSIGRGRIADDLLDHLEQQAGMLLEAVEGGPGVLVATYEKQFRFLHLSFQEYLAACELLYRPGDPRPRGLPVLQVRRFPEGLAEHMRRAPALWANVLRLGVDELLFQGRPADAWELLCLCCEPYQKTGAAAAAVPLALRVVEETRLLAAPPERRLAAFCADLCSVATAVLTAVARFPAPAQRDIAGRLLGSDPFPGHDPRKGVGLRPDGLPDIDWAPIPNDGAFIYQKNARRAEPDFWIARYPVTYAQYRAFLDAKDGFANPQWWRGLAAPKDQQQRPGEQRFPHWNHPAENVSWYDAIAFCRWLTAKVKAQVAAKAAGWEMLLPPGWDARLPLRITLPTEWQWEKAARGQDGRQFPWGEKYISGNANIDETYGSSKVGPHYLQKTSAVGMYPQGASPYGVLDMSGNVWEWCLNEYEKPDRTQEEGAANRVLRGGSWYNYVDVASALARIHFWSYDRLDDGGFRVVGVAVVPR
jgi:formylglycine-generating enzyme required for sulfatase activity